MVVRTHSPAPLSIRGLRMNADEYLALGETFERYELIDGVVCMSPSPSFLHQKLITEVSFLIREYLKGRPIGEVAVEIDVRLTDGLVYRPDVVFLRTDKAARCDVHIAEAPDVVVEVISPDSSRIDRETKRRDYERFGVAEYWIIDPRTRSFTFFGLRDGKFVELIADVAHFESAAIPGFRLDLDAIRAGMN
jgi:Uma2 family endonuclease